MSPICNNSYCKKFRAPTRHVEGIARCRFCDIFIYWDGSYCPCCNGRVSRRVRNRTRQSSKKRFEKNITRI